MSRLEGLLANVLIWAAAAAVFTFAVCWVLAAWFPGTKAREEPARPKAARGEKREEAEKPRKAA